MKGRASRAVYMRLQPSLLSPPSDPEERDKKKKGAKKTAPVAVCIELDTTRNCSRDRVLAKRCTAESIQRKSGVDLSSIPETCLEAKGECVSIARAESADQHAGKACVGEGSCARDLSRYSFRFPFRRSRAELDPG